MTSYPRLTLNCTHQPLFPPQIACWESCVACAHPGATSEQGLVRGTNPVTCPGLGLAGAHGSPAVLTYPPILHAHCQHNDVADILLPHQPPEVLYRFLQGPLGGNELLLGCIALGKRKTEGFGKLLRQVDPSLGQSQCLVCFCGRGRNAHCPQPMRAQFPGS